MAATIILISASLVSCSKGFKGKSLENTFSLGDQCPTTKSLSSEQRVPSLFETKGKKLQINENNNGESSAFASEKSINPMILAGKQLVVVVDEKCVQIARNARSIMSREGITSVLKISNETPVSEKSFLVRTDRDMRFSELEDTIESDECIKGVNENVIHRTLMTPNDPRFSQQEHLTNIRASEAWDTFYNSDSGVKETLVIAIIDTGVDLGHPDLEDNLWVNSKEISGNGIDDDKNGYVDDVHGYNFGSETGDPTPEQWPSPDQGGEAHGTHVAGLAAAKTDNNVGVSGVNGMKAQIMALNVFGAVAGASTEHIDNAIRYAADNGASIINLSLGGPGSSSSTDAAIKYALSKGAVLTIASGNSNEDAAGYTPARYGKTNAGAITIGAVDAASNTKCSFSNYNAAYVELAAPGCKGNQVGSGVLSTLNGGGYGRLQGTSMASPITAGAASLAYSLIWARTGKRPTPATVEEVMKSGARVQSAVSDSFMDGKVLDLTLLAAKITTLYSTGQGPILNCN